MKKYFIFLLSLFIIITWTSSILSQHPIFGENFDYTAGENLTSHGWSAHSGSGTNPITVVSPGLTYSGYPYSGIGNAALLDNTGEDVHQNFSTYSSGIVYASFMLNVASDGAPTGYFFHLRSSSYIGKVFIKDDNGNLKIGLSKTSSTGTYATANYSYNTTYLVVLKYEFKTNTTTDDEVSLFIFSSGVPSSEPVTPDIGPLGSGENDQNINAISLRQYSSSQNITIDGIRFGPSWQLDAPLPIELSSFTASIIKQHVKLRWTTESEIDNVGFEIVRSLEKEGNYQTIATYLNHPELKGQGNSSTRTTYSFIDVTVAPGNTYWYKLVDVDNNGNRTFHGPVSVTLKKGVHPISETFPDNFKLYANYPNPFNPSTTLRFDIPKLSSGVNHATLTIYNSLGEVVSVLHQGTIAPGSYEVIWDGTDSAGNLLPSGIYYARLHADFFLQTIKMVMLK